MKICDVCKKELASGVAKVEIPSWLFSVSHYSYDMCIECSKKVHDYIRKLAEEARSKREGGDK